MVRPEVEAQAISELVGGSSVAFKRADANGDNQLTSRDVSARALALIKQDASAGKGENATEAKVTGPPLVVTRGEFDAFVPTVGARRRLIGRVAVGR